MFSTGFNRGMRRQLVDMADLGSDWLLSSSWSNCMAATFGSTSAGIGQGATFTVRLPLIAVYSEPDKERRQPRAALAREPAFARSIPRQCSRAGGGR